MFPTVLGQACWSGPFIEGHMTDMRSIGWPTKKLKRVALSPSSAEIQQACNTEDDVFAARLLWRELNGHAVTTRNVTEAVEATPGIVVLDAECVHDAPHNSSSTALGLTEKRSGIELLGLNDTVATSGVATVRLRWLTA